MPLGRALLNSRGYFVRVKCVTAHAQSIKSRGLAAHASAIKRGVMSSTLRTLRRSDQVFSHKRQRSINVATTLRGGNDCANECIIIERGRLNVPKISSSPHLLRLERCSSVISIRNIDSKCDQPRARLLFFVELSFSYCKV